MMKKGNKKSAEKQQDTNTCSQLLDRFITNLPIDKRQHVASILLHMRQKMNDTIHAKESIKDYISNLHGLRDQLEYLPLHVREKVKATLLEGLEASLSETSVAFAIFTTALCIIELTAWRNVDRLDLEGKDVWTTVTQLASSVLPKLASKVTALRTNIPVLHSWALGMLVFTSHACVEWLNTQKCGPENQSPREVLQLDSAVLDHASIPLAMRTLLVIQSKRRPFPLPAKPYTMFDVLFSCAISGNFDLIDKAVSYASFDPNSCHLEESEPKVKVKRHNKQSAIADQGDINYSELAQITPKDFETRLGHDSPGQIIAFLRSLHKAITPQSIVKLTELLCAVLRCTTVMMQQIRPENQYATKSKQRNTDYEQVYCLLLQVWCQAVDYRILLTALPQSHIWLAGFMRPEFELMSQSGFECAVVCLSRFLTNYQTLFRTAILASPHWYLQLITDVIVTVIDRLEQAHSKPAGGTEETMCTCVLAISRPFAALGVEEADIRSELSRSVRFPLETVVARIASCRPAQSKNMKGVAQPSTRPILGERIRDLLNNCLLIPMIRAADQWALGQARIGIRPATARVLLNQLIADSDSQMEATDYVTASKLELPLAPIAVGGLRIAEKLAMKRRR